MEDFREKFAELRSEVLAGHAALRADLAQDRLKSMANFDAIDKRFGEIDGHLKQLNEDLKGLRQDTLSLRSTFEQVEARLDESMNKNEGLWERFLALFHDYTNDYDLRFQLLDDFQSEVRTRLESLESKS